MDYTDTIAAIATAPGEGGIGIVRLSGPASVAIAEQLFRPRRPGSLQPLRVRYGHIVDPERGSIVDEALVTFMRGPRSFTREDVVELACHGGPLPLQQVLTLVLGRGARLADPGEFTLRAFLNGRIDLAQAEATLDVIRARTAAGLALAQEQLGGWLSHEVRSLRAELLAPLAYLTALIDFPEDEVEPQDIVAPLRQAHASVCRLLATASQGQVYRQGARAVLVGRPNAGKSSLLNALLQTERAIVTAIPGTTRDTLEETANIHGLPVVLTDTAGISATADEVERIGVARSRQALRQADLALLVLDTSRPAHPDDGQIATLTHDLPTILVLSKADLPRLLEPQAVIAGHPRLRGRVATALPASSGPVEGSPQRAPDSGLDALRAAISGVLLGGSALSGAHLVSNPRHTAALQRAADNLAATLSAQAAGVVPDLLTVNLTAAINALGEITGESVGEDLLGEIFSRFCIGK